MLSDLRPELYPSAHENKTKEWVWTRVTCWLMRKSGLQAVGAQKLEQGPEGKLAPSIPGVH